MNEHASMVASRMVAYNRCLDRTELTATSYQALEDEGGVLRQLGLELQDPGSAASKCVEGRFMAAEAELWVGNSLTPSSTAPIPSTESLVEMYNWFVANDVKVINESWGTSRSTDVNQSVVVDYYARKHGLVVVQASNNIEPGNDPAVNKQVITVCKGLNSICVGSLQPGASVDPDEWVGAAGPTGWELGWSAGLDPRAVNIQPLATKPDLMSSGVLTDVAGYLRARAQIT